MNRTDTTVADLSHFAGQGSARRASTVPMPPRRWVSRVVLPVIILLSVLGILASAGLDGLLPATDVQVVPVLIKSTTAATGGQIVQAPGWVEPDPYPHLVSALADGIVSEVLVLEGQAVKAGDVVARLVDADAKLALAHAESQIKQMTAAVQQAEAVLAAAEATWENPIERVKARDQSAAMLKEAKAELERLPAEIDVETAKLREAEEKLDRVKRLYQGQQLTGMEMIRAQAGYDVQAAQLKAKRASQPVLEARVAQREAEAIAAARNLELRIEEKKQLADAKAALLMAQAELSHAHVTRDEAALRLSRMEIRTPTDGIVMNRMIEPGSKLLISMNDPNGSIALKTFDPAKLQVRVDVPLADAAAVSVEQDAQVVVDVLPDRTFKGRVTRVVNEADVQKNTLQFKVAIIDPEPRLRPEMLARVRILIPARTGATEGPRQAFYIPAELVQGGGKESFVMITDRSGSRAVRRLVTVGDRDAQGWVEVTAGLQVGDQLLAGEAMQLKEGARIRVTGESGSVGTAAKGDAHGHD